MYFDTDILTDLKPQLLQSKKAAKIRDLTKATRHGPHDHKRVLSWPLTLVPSQPTERAVTMARSVLDAASEDAVN